MSVFDVRLLSTVGLNLWLDEFRALVSSLARRMKSVSLQYRRLLLMVVCVLLSTTLGGRAAAQGERPTANIWVDATSRSNCEEMETLPSLALGIAENLPAGNYRPDIYFGMQKFEGTAEGQVAVHYLGTEMFSKQLSAGSCADVVAALLFSLQIYVDGAKTADFVQLEKAAAGGQEESKGAPPGWPGPDIDPASVNPTLEDPFGSPGPIRTFNWRPALYVGLVRGFNVLPNSRWGGSGIEISGSIPLDEEIGFDGGARYLMSEALLVEGLRYRFASTSFFLGPSRAWRLSDASTLRMSFTAVVTLIHASVFREEERADSPPFGSAGTSLNATLSSNPWSGFLCEARLSGQAMSLNAVFLGPSGDVIWEQPLLGLIGSLSVGWGGEKVQQKRRFMGKLPRN